MLEKCKIHGEPWICARAMVLFYDKNRINIYFASKIHNIINYSTLDNSKIDGKVLNKNLWEKNDNLFKDFCKTLKVNKRYWETNETFRKLFIFSSFSIKSDFLNILYFKMIILKNFIYKLLISLVDKSKKTI